MTTAPTDDSKHDLTEVVQRLLDENQIRDLTSQFSDACNTHDLAKFGKLWTSDGIWTIDKPREGRGEGTEAVVDMLRGLLNAWEFFFQMTHSGIIQVDGDTAQARWNVQEIARMPESAGFYNNLGIYEDELRRVDGTWVFAKRRYEYIYLDDAALNGQSMKVTTTLDL